MNWHYSINNQQLGPINDAELSDLVARGVIRADTLLWREGMANWESYSAVQAGAASAAGGVTCCECGQVFPPDQVMPFGDRAVCAGCKPIALQRLREGAVAMEAMPTLAYAGFWIRFGAQFIDGLLMWIVGIGIGLACGQTLLEAIGVQGAEDFNLSDALAVCFQLLVGAAYVIFFLGKYGATPGKLALGLRVVVADGSPISYARAAGRYFASALSYMVCCVGFIMVAWDKEKRALHDMICNTRVIRK